MLAPRDLPLRAFKARWQIFSEAFHHKGLDHDQHFDRLRIESTIEDLRLSTLGADM